MATRTWTGAVDGDWSDLNNWDEGAVPISGDDVFIVSGSVDIDGGDYSAVTLDRLVVGARYRGTIATTGTKLQINATDLDYAGNGDMAWFYGTYGTVTVQDTSTNTQALNLAGLSVSDTIGGIRVLGGKGTINVASNCEITTTIEQIGADSVTLTIADGTTIGGALTLTIDSGKVELSEAVPTVNMLGGFLEIDVDGGTFTTVSQYGGKIQHSPSDSCTITTLVIYSGKFDSSESTAPSFTITNLTIHEDGTLDERSGLANAIYTNAINMEGGEIRYDAGRELTIT